MNETIVSILTDNQGWTLELRKGNEYYGKRFKLKCCPLIQVSLAFVITIYLIIKGVK